MNDVVRPGLVRYGAIARDPSGRAWAPGSRIGACKRRPPLYFHRVTEEPAAPLQLAR